MLIFFNMKNFTLPPTLDCTFKIIAGLIIPVKEIGVLNKLVAAITLIGQISRKIIKNLQYSD